MKDRSDIHSEILRLRTLKKRKCKDELSLSYWYAEIGDIDTAITCCKNASVMRHGWGVEQSDLLFRLESFLGKRPFDADLHKCLGLTFQRAFVDDYDGPYESELPQAEAEYKQALALSPGQKNAEIEKLLAALPMLKIKASRRSQKTDKDKEQKHSLHLLKQETEASWHIPAHEGFLLTRCNLLVDGKGKVRGQPKVVVTSGSIDHDQSALTAVSLAPYPKYVQPFLCGLFDYACSSEGNSKSMDFFVHQRVSLPHD